MDSTIRGSRFSLLLCASESSAQARTTRVSVDSAGIEANGASTYSATSRFGRYTVFESQASNLVAGDTNKDSDIFVHDAWTGQTVRVSVSSTGVEANDGSYYSFISADGRYVAFNSYADNLVSGDTNWTSDVFVHDLHTGTTVARQRELCRRGRGFQQYRRQHLGGWAVRGFRLLGHEPGGRRHELLRGYIRPGHDDRNSRPG